jgi:hypothetical protein
MAHLEINADHTININDKLGTALFVHGNYLFNEFDHNDDGFLDKPMGHQINLYNRWEYHSGDIWENMSGYSILNDEKKGGQIGYHKDNSNSSGNLWGMDVKTQRYNIYTKNGFILNDEGMNIGTILSFTHHKQNSFFGNRNFDGEQNSFYANFMFQNPFLEDDDDHNAEAYEYTESEPNTLTAGVSLQYDNFMETFQNDPFAITVGAANNARIIVPGVFAEYSIGFFEGFRAVAGLRADFPDVQSNSNSSDKNIFISPRLHLKYNLLNETLIFAGSVGRGHRIARVLEENSGYLASNRQFVIPNNLEPEDAWNYGVNATWFFDLFDLPFTLNADFYRTDFINQVVVDLDKSQDFVYFYNLDGKSYSNSYQIDLTVEPFDEFFVTAAYRVNDVKVTTDGHLQDKALQSKQRAFLNLQYSTDMSEWMFDFTVDYNGRGRLPKLLIDGVTVAENYSPFLLLSAQITKNFGDFSVYVGAENLTNYMIHHAIKGAETPFAKGFDASMIYGPVTGRHFYLGMRYKIY